MPLKRFQMLLIALIMISSFAIADDNSNAILLQLSCEPINIEQVFSLPDGTFLIDYYALNESEFWHNLGRDDVMNHITEVVDASGNSVWYYRDSGDVLPEDMQNYLFQYMINSDCIVRESYTDVSMEHYYRKVWDFKGNTLANSINSILQDEDEARYIFSMYPYILEVWRQGKQEKKAVLTDCADKYSVELDYYYGSRTALAADHDFYLVFDAEGTVKLIWYEGDTKQVYYYVTNLDMVPGKLIRHDSNLYVLLESYQDNETVYSLFTCPCPIETTHSLSFELVSRFSINANWVIDELFVIDDSIFCIVGDPNEYFYIGRFDRDKVLLDNRLNGSIRCFENRAGLTRFLISDKPGKENWVITVSEKSYQDFLTYLDQPQ